MRTNIVIGVFIIGVLAAGLGSAEEMSGGMKKGMMGGEMMKQGMMKEGMMPMHGMMMKMMMDKSVVATSDGGVVVLIGNTLTKYDKNLNFVKEVKLKVDTEDMQKQMMEMMKSCSMMGQGMMGDNVESSDQTQNAAESVSVEPDHAAHH